MSDDYESDLTELSDESLSDFEASKSKKKVKGKTKAIKGYRIRDALKVPRATTYTAQALYGRLA